MIAEMIIAVLSSGVLAMLLTLRATRRKASAEAKGVEIDNNQKLLENFETYIVEPLKTEVNEIRENVKMLQKAVSEVANCPFRDECPVADRLDELRNAAKEPDAEQQPGGDECE